MNIIICDDELEIALNLQEILKDLIETDNNILVYTDYKKLGNDIKTKLDNIDILFMDIKLNGFNGVDLVKDNQKYFKNTKIIYITGYDDYIESAFETEPIYVLRKPMTVDKVKKALDKALDKIKNNKEYFILKTLKEIIKIKLDKLLYIESDGRLVNLYTVDGLITSYGKLSEIESKLNDRFIRTHKSFLVNIDKIKIYKPNRIILENNKMLPISRTYAKKCKEKVLEYIKESDF